jgi:hypothetical protein
VPVGALQAPNGRRQTQAKQMEVDMSRRMSLLIVPTAILVLFAGLVGTAHAYPSSSSTCAGCHPGSGVTVSAVETTNNGVTAAYDVTVAGGSGAKGWTVFAGSTRITGASTATGQFSVAVGSTYRVWGVDTGAGSAYADVSPLAPVLPPTPEPTTTPTPEPTTTPGPVAPTLTLVAGATQLTTGQRVTLSGTLSPFKARDRIIVEMFKRGRWVKVSVRSVRTDGTWSLRLKMEKRGTFQYRVRFRGTADRAALTSTPITLTVVRAPHRHHHH